MLLRARQPLVRRCSTLVVSPSMIVLPSTIESAISFEVPYRTWITLTPVPFATTRRTLVMSLLST